MHRVVFNSVVGVRVRKVFMSFLTNFDFLGFVQRNFKVALSNQSRNVKQAKMMKNWSYPLHSFTPLYTTSFTHNRCVGV